MPWTSGAAYIDGEFRPIEEAKISVLDLGLTRGDCTYDVVHVWKGRFFRLDDHLDRFHESMARLRLDPGHSRDEVADILHEVVSRAGLRDSFVSMTCTRGRPAPGSRDLRTCRNNFYCFAVPFIWITTPEQQQSGVHMWVSDIPRIPPESVDPIVKNYHWLDLDMALFDAYDHGAQLVVLGDGEGAVAEGAGYNVFAFVDGQWLTPDSGALRGVTRETVMELIERAGDRVAATRLTVDDLRRADEVMVTSTAGGVMPVSTLHGKPVGDGTPGPHTCDVHKRYWACHDDPAWSTAVRGLSS
jgi:branched-chain amino acid aminotransferase